MKVKVRVHCRQSYKIGYASLPRNMVVGHYYQCQFHHLITVNEYLVLESNSLENLVSFDRPYTTTIQLPAQQTERYDTRVPEARDHLSKADDFLDAVRDQVSQVG